MAVVLDALVSFVLEGLMKMAADEVDMLRGVPDEVNKLEGKLQVLKAVLADAERRSITEKAVQRWVLMLKDVMYEATDILDISIIHAQERKESIRGEDSRGFNPIALMQNTVFTHDTGNRIKDLNKKLDSICESGTKFNFIEQNQQDRGILTHPAGSKTSPVIERSSLIGKKIEEDTVDLVNMLTDERWSNHPDDYIVVAISGTGGIGKTALAQNIYNHQTIKDKFSKRMWLSITQACTETELLRDAIYQAQEKSYSRHKDCHDHGKSILESTLADTIKDKKTFVVLDDMWTAAKWNDVLKASFSYVARGSRVLVTTRDDRVARSMKAQYLHHVNYLGPRDAWTLLKKEVITTERDQLEIDTLKDIGSNILGRCGGLPLAIKVIGGLLRQRSINKAEWERILDNPAWSIDGMPEELNHAIYLSYDDLPPHLKQCLIYYSLIPQKTYYCTDQLIEMWISEGLVSSRHSDDLEQIGRDYLKELIMRNLIQPYTEFIGHSHSVMHDVVRSFCQYMVRDEALVAHMGEGGIGSRLLSHKFRFLSIGVESGSDELEWSVLQNQSSLRTLISCCPIRFKHNDSLTRLSRLRTIHLENVDFIPLLADHLGELKLLRYLTIESTKISSLPDTIGQLKLLQHIGLSGCEKMVRLPNGIVKLKQLRSVYLGEAVNIIPKKFGELTNLRKILNFPANMDGGANGWCTLEELGPLSQLRDLSLKGLENVHPSSLAAKAMLRSKKHLGRLALKCSSIIEDDGGSVKRVVTEEKERHIEEVFSELCPPDCINHLTIDGYYGRRLPEWIVSMTGVSLTRLQILELWNLAFCTQLPSGLCQLPCLQTLIVRHAPAIKYVGPELMRHTHAHNNKRHSRVSVSFPSLKELVFIGMVSWEEWEWKRDVEAMPVLLELTLQNCRSLTRLPPGLSLYARELKKLNLRDVHWLYSLENFPCVSELSLRCCHYLKRITNLPSLQNLDITCCSRLAVLEAVPALRYLYMQSSSMRRLPRYLQGLNLTRLDLCCELPLLCSMVLGKSTYNWNKFCHIHRVEAHTHNGSNGMFTVTYTKDPRYLQTNISSALFNLLGQSPGTTSKNKGNRAMSSSGHPVSPSLETTSNNKRKHGNPDSGPSKRGRSRSGSNQPEPVSIEFPLAGEQTIAPFKKNSEGKKKQIAKKMPMLPLDSPAMRTRSKKTDSASPAMSTRSKRRLSLDSRQ